MKRRKKSESKQLDDIDLFDYSDGDDKSSNSPDEEVTEEVSDIEESKIEESDIEETYNEIIDLDKVDISKNSDLKNIPASSMFAGVFTRKEAIEESNTISDNVKAVENTEDTALEDRNQNEKTIDAIELDGEDSKSTEEVKSDVDVETTDEKQADEDNSLEEVEDAIATKGIKIAGISAICIAVLGLVAIFTLAYFLVINPYYSKEKPKDSFEHSNIASATDLNPSGVVVLATPSDMNFDDIKDVVADIDANSTINNVPDNIPVATLTDATATDATATDATPSDATVTDAEAGSDEGEAEDVEAESTDSEADGTDAEDYYE